MDPKVTDTTSLATASRLTYWHESDARRVLAACSASGRSLSAFAREHGLRPDRLYRWRRKLRGDEAPAFYPIQVVAEKVPTYPEARNAMELVLRCGRRIILGPEFDAVVLRRLVEAVESWPC